MMTSYQHWRSYAKRKGSTWSGKLQMQSLATSSASALHTDTKKLSGTASTALACSTHLDASFGQAKNACVCLFDVLHVLQAIEKLAASAILCCCESVAVSPISMPTLETNACALSKANRFHMNTLKHGMWR